jgi:hypothetical protein
MYRRRGPRPLLVLQWILMALIVMFVFKALGLPWFFWFFPFIFVCSWGGRRHGRRRWHHRGRRRRHHRDDYDEYDDDDTDYV